VAGNAREQVAVVMILPPHEISIMVEGKGQTHLVARRAELGGPDDGSHESLLVHFGLGLHEREVDPLQDRIITEGEGVMVGLLDRVSGVAPGVVHRGDGVAGGAGDPRLTRGIVHVVIIGVVELTGEKRDRVVTARAPARSLG
jgi:hypothetical protein